MIRSRSPFRVVRFDPSKRGDERVVMNKQICTAFVLALSPVALGGYSWTFDTDAEGWGTLNDARDFTWDGSLGNPAGAIRARDIGDGRIWYFAAPGDFAGNRAGFYGGVINWDILGIQGNQTSIPGRADVMLVGAGLEIGIDASVLPLNSGWTSWSADIDEQAGWRIINSLANGTLSATAATEAQIRAVLADLDGFYIRGEYTNGADQSAIDNVWFVPSPGAFALLGMGGLIGAGRRR